MAISGYCGYFINGYCGYSINDCWWLFYEWLLVAIYMNGY